MTGPLNGAELHNVYNLLFLRGNFKFTARFVNKTQLKPLQWWQENSERTRLPSGRVFFEIFPHLKEYGKSSNNKPGGGLFKNIDQKRWNSQKNQIIFPFPQKCRTSPLWMTPYLTSGHAIYDYAMVRSQNTVETIGKCCSFFSKRYYKCSSFSP